MAKFCSQCGAPLVEGSAFCTSCGARQAAPAPAPVAPAPAPVAPAPAPVAPAPAPVAPAPAPVAPAPAPVAPAPAPVAPAPAPAYQQPAYQQPAYQQPAYQQPAYQQPVYRMGPSPFAQLVTGKISSGKTALFLLAEQLLVLLLFSMPGLDGPMSVQTYVDMCGSAWILHTILLLALIASMIVFLVPSMKANGLVFKKPFPMGDLACGITHLAASAALFLATLITIIESGIGFSVWGILYVVFAVLCNGHLGFCLYKTTK